MSTATMTVIDQLIDIYLTRNESQRYKKKMSYEGCVNYFTKLYNQGSILCQIENGIVTAMVEYWLVNQTQLKRIVTNQRFDADGENIVKGRICYISDVWVDPELRKGRTIVMLKRKLFDKTKHCSFYIGEEHNHGGRLNWAMNRATKFTKQGGK